MRGVRLLLFITLACIWAVAQAQVYTWVDAQGVRHYSDRPQSQQAEKLAMPQPASAQPAEAAAQNTADAATTQHEITILRPQPAADLRSEQGLVAVAISVAGDLAVNEKLVYYLDGQTVANSPTQALQFKLTGLPAGPHALQVALQVDGQEAQRTAPVAFSVTIAAPDEAEQAD